MNLALNRSVQKGGCQVLGLNRYSIQQWLKTIDTIIFDGDGVLWKNDEVLDKAPETFNALRAMGKEAYICSNSSVNSVAGNCKKAQEMGFLVAKNEILSSSQTLARFMKQKKFKKKVYVVGGQGIIDELKLVGIESLPLDHPSLQGFSMPEHAHTIFLDPNVGAVVVGNDKDFNIIKLTKACCYLKDPEVMFVATNRDSAFPSAPGRMIPRAGVMISAIQAASQRMPFTCGKPNPYMCIDLMRQGTIQPERTLIIGDTMNTDILFGYNCGFQTLMVGTGVSSYQDAIEAQASKVPLLYQQVPDLYVPKLSNLLPFLSSRNR
ncbi:glycerol-3-phosphate phosphatase [Drosophila gunungcola]|uniref:glycerol-3-phosphate phosphatase n=1 Tax=Drosophila gunungcola TaxID=103775 RepID=UPI0022E7592E|nr:glycerol-3-phosphate phosphatase [Drosophila gunungcola]